MPLRVSRIAASLEESATLAISEKAARLKEQGRDIVSLSAGEPDYDTPNSIKEAAVEALRQGRTKYTPSSGILPLRKAIAEKMRRDHGVNVDPAQVLVSCGAKHALFNGLYALLEPGDEVLIPSPCWVSYPEMVKAVGAIPVVVPGDPSNQYKVTAELLEARRTSRTRLLLLNSPSNPTGIVYQEEQLRRLGEWVVRQDLAVISDEIYEKLVYDNARHTCFASLGGAVLERTMVVNGVSKSYAMTGWRIGYMVGPREAIDVAGRFQSQVTSNPTSVSQYAALRALEGDQGFIGEMLQDYQRRRDWVGEQLTSVGVPFVPPQGAFYVFVDVSRCYGKEIEGSVRFAERLLDEEGLAVVPGQPFGSDAHIRLSFSVGMPTLQKGMERLARFIRRQLHG